MTVQKVKTDFSALMPDYLSDDDVLRELSAFDAPLRNDPDFTGYSSQSDTLFLPETAENVYINALSAAAHRKFEEHDRFNNAMAALSSALDDCLRTAKRVSEYRKTAPKIV